MTRKPEEFAMETRKAMRGGDGEVKIFHIWKPGEEMKSRTRMYAKLVLEKGCSIGYHVHDEEEEMFYILSGTAELDDNGTKVILHPGESSITGGGAGHALRNAGDETLEVLALIAKY